MPPRTARKPAGKPVFTALTPEECRTVLGRNHVGRIAFVRQNVVDIEPVHYVASDSWLFVRSAEGTKLEAFAHDPYVAFEVDEIEDTFDWRSVVAHGTIYLMADRGSRPDRLVFEHALRALREFIPDTMTESDPTPFRQTIYGVHIDRVSGRRGEQLHRKPGRRPLRFDTPPAARPSTPHGF